MQPKIANFQRDGTDVQCVQLVEVAARDAFLLRDEATAITGQPIVFCGGPALQRADSSH